MKRDNRYKSIYDTVRLNIRKYRRKKGITQQELADLADLSHGYIRDIESINMVVTFSLDAVEKIANALDVKIKDMFEEETKEDN
jgi:transcriptional regulator with XRE-family HTH domain